MIAIEKTRLKQTDDPLLMESHRAVIADLSAQCARIEGELARRLAEDPELARTMAILVSIPGIGTRIATLLVTDLPEIGKRDRKAIASLAGLAPHISQSGNAPPRAAISGGRPCVRAALYMAALVVSRREPTFRKEYEAMRLAGKPAKVALIPKVAGSDALVFMTKIYYPLIKIRYFRSLQWPYASASKAIGMIAIARKLLVLANALVKANITFDNATRPT